MDETAAKVAFVLEAGLRPDQRSASRFVAERQLRRLTLADFRRRCGGARDVSTAGVWSVGNCIQCTHHDHLAPATHFHCHSVRSGGIVAKQA